MGESQLNPVKTQNFRKFLIKMGCNYVRTNSSHEIWTRQDLNRPIVIQGNKKEVPKFHIQTNLRTLGISIKKFKEIIEDI